MKTYKVGLIRVLTTGDEELLQLHVPGGVTMYSGSTGGNS